MNQKLKNLEELRGEIESEEKINYWIDQLVKWADCYSLEANERKESIGKLIKSAVDSAITRTAVETLKAVEVNKSKKGKDKDELMNGLLIGFDHAVHDQKTKAKEWLGKGEGLH